MKEDVYRYGPGAFGPREWLVRGEGNEYGAFSVVRNPCWAWRRLDASWDYSSNFWWADALEFV